MAVPKISIIIPVYNTAPYLAQCFDGILTQTLQDFEVICVNDASTDASREILQSYAHKDARFHIIDLPKNQGAGPARNAGIEVAQGEFLTFCDADDFYPPYALKTLYTRAVNTQCPVSAGNILCMDYTLQYAIAPSALLMSLHFHSTDCVNPDNFIPLYYPWYHPRYMIRRNFLLEHGIQYPAFLHGEDPPFLAHVLCHTDKVAICPDIVYWYREAAPNAKKYTSAKAYEEYFAHFRYCAKLYKEHNKTRPLALFLQISLTMILHFRYWLTLSFSQRVRLSHAIKELASYEECFTKENFAPFTMHVEKLQKDTALAIAYPRMYPFLKITEKIIAKCFWKRSDI